MIMYYMLNGSTLHGSYVTVAMLLVHSLSTMHATSGALGTQQDEQDSYSHKISARLRPTIANVMTI